MYVPECRGDMKVPFADNTRKTYMKRIGVGLTLIHDSEKTHFAVVGFALLKEKVYSTNFT